MLYPNQGHVSGGNWIYYDIGPRNPGVEDETYYIGDTPVLDVAPGGERGIYLQVPPSVSAGPKQICQKRPSDPEPICLTDSIFTYTYYESPIILSMKPTEQSFLPDPLTVSLVGRGFSINPGIKVIFGSQSASNVEFDYERSTLTCTPPPFPAGSPVPHTVDLRVINPGGGETVLPAAYTYKQMTPRIKDLTKRSGAAWRSGLYLILTFDRLIAGDVRIHFGSVPAYAEVFQYAGQAEYSLKTIAPPLPPGKVDITVINGDGGIYTAENAFEYIGTSSTNYHSSDTDKNFRVSVSEILRVVQLKNAGGFHCDSTTEDGFAPGLDGDQTCAPHASDYEPQDWQISLPELLQLIQFYNLFCYEPCTTDPSGYCPPIDYRESRG